LISLDLISPDLISPVGVRDGLSEYPNESLDLTIEWLTENSGVILATARE
jgi:hypothetical protein